MNLPAGIGGVETPTVGSEYVCVWVTRRDPQQRWIVVGACHMQGDGEPVWKMVAAARAGVVLALERAMAASMDGRGR